MEPRTSRRLKGRRIMLRPKEERVEREGGGGSRSENKPWTRETGWRARQRSRRRDEAVEKRETVGPRKDRAAAPAYQLFQESSARISINSNDKCGPLWQRLINSVRGELARARIQIIQCHRPEQVFRGSMLSPIVFWNYYCSFTCNGAVRAFVHSCLV